jgi:hypothetical protein
LSDRKPLALIVNPDGVFDGRKRPSIPTGWVHLPAEAEFPALADQALRSPAKALKIPNARYLAETTYDNYHKRDKNPRYTGILVPAEDAENIATLAERMIRGELRMGGSSNDEIIDAKTGRRL